MIVESQNQEFYIISCIILTILWVVVLYLHVVLDLPLGGIVPAIVSKGPGGVLNHFSSIRVEGEKQTGTFEIGARIPPSRDKP